MSTKPANLPERQSKFVGREAFLQKINISFNSSQILILNGVSGVGKTSIAIEHCHRLINYNSNTNIFWINAQSSDFNLGDELKKANETSLVVSNQANGTLIVLDGLESLSSIELFLKDANENVKFLITSTTKLKKQTKNMDQISIEPFTLAEAVFYAFKSEI